ncbi:ras-related protein Rab-24 [Lepeophtheirus salmonis]|uniref:Ras-related protein Rab-24 n=1 Tax=Lepeophtheirus salmonis TaxID=72036 RepID=D3PIW7_LEPSM|nr:ras-related protein Rab-24-like [Lepeophtheirus salmonis]ADD38503.1 Ras-related protein Rab-24 [Lepeophtheirus salmonis]
MALHQRILFGNKDTTDYPEIKTVTLGNTNCGKTSLIQMFIRRNIKQAEIQAGSAFNRFKFLLGNKERNPNSENVLLGIWDTTGDKHFYSISTYYQRNSFVVLVCYDMSDSKSLDNVAFWCEKVRKYSEDRLIYIVGCKSDLEKKICPLELKALVHKYKAKTFETSSYTGENLKKLFIQLYYDYLEEKRRQDQVVKPSPSELKELEALIRASMKALDTSLCVAYA